MNYDQLVCEAESGETFSLPSHGATGQQTRYTHKSHMNQIMKLPKQETFEQHNIYIYIYINKKYGMKESSFKASFKPRPDLHACGRALLQLPFDTSLQQYYPTYRLQ